MIEANGERFPVPPELVRSWNGKNDEDKINRKLRWVGQKPEWLTLQATQTLVADFPAAASYLPTLPGHMSIYGEYGRVRQEIIEFAKANPAEISEYERDQALGDLKDNLYAQLVAEGRNGEVIYAEAWPLQRLAYTGKLPPSLEPVLTRVNAVQQQLASIEKGPTSKEGRQLFLSLTEWMEQVYFPSTPGAAQALDGLGLVMFDESVRATVYAKLLYGDFFGTLD